MSNATPEESNICPLGERYQRYWDKLSLPERRMKIDVEGLYSMDLQEVALQLAQKIEADRIVDAFCGIGGATIAFARTGKFVKAIEIDPGRLEMARHNALLFAVQDRIIFHQGDAMDLLQSSEAAVYLDPPWGGPSYGRREQFSLKCFAPDGEGLLRRALSASREVILKLPKNFDFSELVPIREPTEIIANELAGRLEYYTAIFRTG
jgi:trimethylguanosine synthase